MDATSATAAERLAVLEGPFGLRRRATCETASVALSARVRHIEAAAQGRTGSVIIADGTGTSASFGYAAVILGFLSFAAVVGHFFAGPIDPPPPVEVSIAEKAASIRDATVAALKGEEYEAESRVTPKTLDDYLTFAIVCTAALAILLAAIGFIRHERVRPAIAGAGLGAMAITFQVAIVFFMALLFTLLVSTVLDQLDFSF